MTVKRCNTGSPKQAPRQSVYQIPKHCGLIDKNSKPPYLQYSQDQQARTPPNIM